MDLGKKIKRMRNQKGLTQEELADRCELTKGYISQLENNLNSPSIATLTDILSALGSNLAEFFREETEEKVKVIEDVFAGRVDDDITGFFVLIVKKDRQTELLQILEYFIDKVKDYKKIGVAYVTTAVEIGESTKKSIEDKLKATTDYVAFEMNYSVDKSIIGGMIIRIGDRVVDSSIKSKLESMADGLYKVHLTTM